MAEAPVTELEAPKTMEENLKDACDDEKNDEEDEENYGGQRRRV